MLHWSSEGSSGGFCAGLDIAHIHADLARQLPAVPDEVLVDLALGVQKGAALPVRFDYGESFALPDDQVTRSKHRLAGLDVIAPALDHPVDGLLLHRKTLADILVTKHAGQPDDFHLPGGRHFAWLAPALAQFQARFFGPHGQGGGAYSVLQTDLLGSQLALLVVSQRVRHHRITVFYHSF